MNFLKKLFASNSSKIDLTSENTRYLNSDWNFELTIPKNWEILSENDIQNFPWMQPVRLAEPFSTSPRTAVTILAQVFEEDGSGLEQYMNKAEKDLRGYFKEFNLISKKQRNVAGWPAAWMTYSYRSDSGTVKELNVTAFIGKGKLLGFQFLCESEKGRANENFLLFESIIDSLNAGSAGIRLPYVTLVGSNICGLCGTVINDGESNAMINLKSGKLNIVCDDCKRKGSL